MSSKDNTALLFFSRKVAQESRCKTFVRDNAGKNQAFGEALISKAQKTLIATGLPVFHFHEGNQKGTTFGERLANAYEAVFNQGYTNVIAVGNDSLDIAKVDWHGIQLQLSAGKAVIGPTVRGGAYLIGITKSLFNKSEFAALPWQSNKAFQSLKTCLSAEGEAILLQEGRDINTFTDVKALLADNNNALDRDFTKLIKWILSFKSPIRVNHGLEIVTSPLLIYSPFRAPPRITASL